MRIGYMKMEARSISNMILVELYNYSMILIKVVELYYYITTIDTIHTTHGIIL